RWLCTGGLGQGGHDLPVPSLLELRRLWSHSLWTDDRKGNPEIWHGADRYRWLGLFSHYGRRTGRKLLSWLNRRLLGCWWHSRMPRPSATGGGLSLLAGRWPWTCARWHSLDPATGHPTASALMTPQTPWPPSRSTEKKVGTSPRRFRRATASSSCALSAMSCAPG